MIVWDCRVGHLHFPPRDQTVAERGTVLLFSGGGDRLGVFQFAGVSVVVLKDDLRMGVSDPTFVPEFLGHVEYIVHFDYGVVGVESFHALEVG